MCFGMPGIPCVYYGSEWGAKARKEEGDPALRACFEEPISNELTEWIAKLAEAKKTSKALQYGDFRSVVLTNGQCVFAREWEGETVFVAINASGDSFRANFDGGCNKLKDLITGEEVECNGGIDMPGYSARFLRK